MAVVERTQLRSEFIKPKIGSRILNSKEELLSGSLADEINDLLEQRGVLVFPQLHFTEQEQMAFTNTLGRLAPEIYGAEIYNISLDPKMNPRAEYLKGSLYWHVDGTMNKVPIRGSILTSKVLPTWGGNTEFCNTYTAYDDLPEEEKAQLESLRVMHSAWASLFYYDPEPSQEKLEDLVSMGEIELPLVWKHRSGRKSLVLGCSAHHVVGMNPTQSTLLLNRLREWATSEPYHYAHEWQVGDTVMWDNTGTMHRARPYDPNCGRLLHRTILQGEEPIQ
jgi:alpha-ketoglutarate-dependent taurine dioxygenase